MGRKSVRECKNIFQQSRENAGLSRAAADELMPFISDDRIEKIESGRTEAHPDEVLAMAEAYRDAKLCNLYCARECPIGRKYIPEISLDDLRNITLQIVNSINILEQKKNRLIEIAVDGKISHEEEKDFSAIKDDLDNIALQISSLQMWLENVKISEK